MAYIQYSESVKFLINFGSLKKKKKNVHTDILSECMTNI